MEISSFLIDFTLVYFCFFLTFLMFAVVTFCIFFKAKVEYIIESGLHTKNVQAMTQSVNSKVFSPKKATKEPEYFDSKVIDDEEEWKIEQDKLREKNYEKLSKKPKINEIRQVMKARYNGKR